MLNWIKKLLDKKNKMVEEYEQLRAECLRSKKIPTEPGTIRYGLHYRQNCIDFIKDAIERRRRLRKEREKKKRDS